MRHPDADSLLGHFALGEFEQAVALLDRVCPDPERMTKLTSWILDALPHLDGEHLPKILQTLSGRLSIDDGFRTTLAHHLANSLQRRDFTRFDHLAHFFINEMPRHPEIEALPKAILMHFDLIARLSHGEANLKDPDVLSCLARNMPLSPVVANCLVGQDHAFNRQVIQAAMAGDVLFPIRSDRLRAVYPNILIYDGNEPFHLIHKLNMMGDHDSAARYLESLLRSPLMTHSTFQVRDLELVLADGAHSNPLIRNAILANEDRLLEIIDALHDNEAPRPTNQIYLWDLGKLNCQRNAGLSRVSRELAVYLGDIGAKRLGRMFYTASHDIIAGADDLLNAHDTLGPFSSYLLCRLFNSADQTTRLDLFENQPSNLAAFLKYALHHQVELRWQQEPDDLQMAVTAYVQFDRWQDAYNQIKPSGQDHHWMIDQLNQAIHSLFARHTLLNKEQAMNHIASRIDRKLLAQTPAWRRWHLSQDLGL